ncbi:maleylacetate reductase [Sphingobium sp. MK2]|uniref:maleylacetate reductase n=1 Tax=Sphingobium sp. MK2 TaxID=3116540 RepID=UPI0032E35D9C
MPGRIIFGSGSIQKLSEELDGMDIRAAAVLSTPGRKAEAEAVATLIGLRARLIYPHAEMHTPVAVSEAAVAALAKAGVDGVIAIGGGSTIGLGKAIALRTTLPQIAIPTTYSGSEVTPVVGQTINGRKATERSLRVLPRLVIYDPDLSQNLPARISAASGLNAMAHAVEALYAENRSPVIEIMAVEGIAAFFRAIPAIIADKSDRAARADALYGAWLCGQCLAGAGMALHHKLCHTLGGSFGLPHAETHSIVLPHALAYNLPAVPHAQARLATVLGDAPSATLQNIARDAGLPVALRDLGMPQTAIEDAADIALASPYWNPRPLERNAIVRLLTRAWQGAVPAAA